MKIAWILPQSWSCIDTSSFCFDRELRVVLCNNKESNRTACGDDLSNIRKIRTNRTNAIYEDQSQSNRDVYVPDCYFLLVDDTATIEMTIISSVHYLERTIVIEMDGDT